ncbi:DUF2933 domain-containing protein [Novosphingobium malaysiense]|uniref:DUF2933 domain-containing protein n=1 Tax=Novosphingobium malaysiense TaxID=1348853 RepID=A0A0B1ZQJ2_9SPHN|nr:DUF2933 domain-containing protein [Novosphingobium malaysiense]KHK93410.1 hypothetical protein LK12_03795 [Novosphingobium malaysiense]
MHQHDEHGYRETPPGHSGTSFWKSRAGTVFLVFLGVIGFLLAYEHRAHIFTGNGFLIVLLLLCPAMHLFMHHGHGGHGK